MSRYPERIVCLTEGTTETLYLLGQGDRIVGVSGYTVRPPDARQKPKVSAFINARFDKIQALHPDLVLAFSDLQADLGAELVKRGIAVVTFNQRSVAEILQMIRMLGGLVGCQDAGERLADRLATDLDRIRASAAGFPRRLRAFFEEWDDPLISGIRWVEELVDIAGGAPIFPELATAALGRDRIVDPAEVARRDPEVIFAKQLEMNFGVEHLMDLCPGDHIRIRDVSVRSSVVLTSTSSRERASPICSRLHPNVWRTFVASPRVKVSR